MGSDRKEDYYLLNKHLKEIGVCIEPFVWLDMHSADNIDYKKAVPIMDDMIGWINDFKIASTLHFWHYQEHNEVKKLDKMIKLAENFLNFIKKELK